MVLQQEFVYIKIRKIMHSVQNWLIEWFVKNTGHESVKISENINQSYFDMQWIDSFQFITLIMEIEGNFHISFNQDEFQNRDFSTVAGLTSIIEKKIYEQNQ